MWQQLEADRQRQCPAARMKLQLAPAGYMRPSRNRGIIPHAIDQAFLLQSMC